MRFDYLLKLNPKTNPQATALRWEQKEGDLGSRTRGALAEKGPLAAPVAWRGS